MIKNLVIKKRIYELVEKGAYGSKINIIFDYSIMILILLNVVALIFESAVDTGDSLSQILKIFEIFSIIIFSLEYLLRIYVSDLKYKSTNRIKSAFKFIFSPYGLIDLLAIIPFYIPFLIKVDLRFLRILRLMRFFRILKINRYNNSINIIGSVIKEKKTELAVTGFVTFLMLFTASFLMYYIEGEAQPDKFSNIITSFWWAIATLTTVGYGDIYPITGFGKIVSGFIAILGIGLVALPTGMISAGFIEKISKKGDNSKKCPHCGKEIN